MFALRGMIEGFYDRLWTWPERTRVLRRAAELGFNVYAYAPKEDRLQNAGWRTPYPASQRRRLAKFAELCTSNGVEPWLALRPVGISYADASDAETVVAKLRDYVELGAARLVLLADDIPATLEATSAGRFTRLADAHAWLISEVRRDIAHIPLVFCPTDYFGTGTDYQRMLGDQVGPEIDMFWTGPEVCSPAITADQARQAGSALQRRPLIWDNYPVNDDGMVDELHVGPIRDRDPALAAEVAGILVNPALEPEATLIPLATWADYLRDPVAYNPDESWRRALIAVCGNERDADAVAALAAACDRSVIGQPWRLPEGAVADPAALRVTRLSNNRLARDLSRFVDQLRARA